MLMREINGKPVKFPGLVSPIQKLFKGNERCEERKRFINLFLYVHCLYYIVKLLPRHWISSSGCIRSGLRGLKVDYIISEMIDFLYYIV